MTDLVTQVAHLRGQRLSFAAIGERLGITKDKAQKIHRKHSATEKGVAFDAAQGTAVLAGLEPIVIADPRPKLATSSPTGVAIISNDYHFPVEDPRAVSIVLGVADDLRPDSFIINGDGPDLLAVSRYPKDWVHQWSLQDERIAWWQFLHYVHELLPANTRIVETNANHSGNGVESRWRRYLSERIPELACLDDVVDSLSYRKVWHPEWSRVELVDEYLVAPGLWALHGDVVRKNAGFSARGMAEKWKASVIHGHTHRMGYTSYRVPGLGERPEGIVRAFEAGCMCKLTAHYGKGFDWQQGFYLVEYDDEGNWNAVPIHIIDGKAIVRGRVYRG